MHTALAMTRKISVPCESPVALAMGAVGAVGGAFELIQPPNMLSNVAAVLLKACANIAGRMLPVRYAIQPRYAPRPTVSGDCRASMWIAPNIKLVIAIARSGPHRWTSRVCT